MPTSYAIMNGKAEEKEVEYQESNQTAYFLSAAYASALCSG